MRRSKSTLRSRMPALTSPRGSWRESSNTRPTQGSPHRGSALQTALCTLPLPGTDACALQWHCGVDNFVARVPATYQTSRGIGSSDLTGGGAPLPEAISSPWMGRGEVM